MLKKDLLIYEIESVKDAFKKLNKSAEKVLLVIENENKLLGTITDGDIRRYILSGKSLNNDIREAYNRNPIYIKKQDYSIELTKQVFIKNKIELVPIINEENMVIDFITWSQVFSDEESRFLKIDKINIPVVIMAGGKGSRLEPFTKIFPKSLVPIGDKPIIEIIIDEFKKQGVKKYYVTLNHRSEMVTYYFNNIDKDYEIKYVKEDEFLGTAGSLRLIEEEIGNVFIVSNCDVIVKADFKEVLSLHREQKSYLTILSSIQHHRIPYGVVNFKEGGEVIDILEKPEYAFTINTGVYLLNKESLKFMPQKTCFDMTDLINSLIKNNKKVFTYPVNENDYIDIGEWEEYRKSVDKLQFFK